MYGVRHHVRPPGIPHYEDCSSFATWVYWVAGLPDPNKLGYNGQGYTGTLVRNGGSISPQLARPGDLAFYGWGFNGVPKHVAVCVGFGRVVSHGSESGPLLLGIRYRSDLHSVRRYF
jgi:cell wall-associated NlpC family hydrolase